MKNESRIVKQNKPVFAAREVEAFVKRISDKLHYVNLNLFQAAIVKGVNQFLVMTADMAEMYLDYVDMSAPLDLIEEEMEYLAEAGYLDAFFFETDIETEKAGPVYIVGRKGAGWLHANDMCHRLGGAMRNCTALTAKKYLAAGRCVLTQWGAVKENTCNSGKIITDNYEKSYNKILFRAYGYVESGNKNIIVEPVRNLPGYEAELLEKLKRMEKTMRSAKCQLFGQDNHVVVVAEDENMMTYLFKVLERKHYKGITLAVTCDDLLVSKENEKILYIPKRGFFGRLKMAA